MSMAVTILAGTRAGMVQTGPTRPRGCTQGRRQGEAAGERDDEAYPDNGLEEADQERQYILQSHWCRLVPGPLQVAAAQFPSNHQSYVLGWQCSV